MSKDKFLDGLAIAIVIVTVLTVVSVITVGIITSGQGFTALMILGFLAVVAVVAWAVLRIADRTV